MRNKLFCFMGLSLSLLVFSFDSAKTPAPPNTILISENLYLDKTEVRNIDWREFVFYVQANSGKDSSMHLLPDSSIGELWYKYTYLPEYNNYPVIGITHDQVLAYCRFRSEAVNQYYKLHNINLKVAFTLPTINQWNTIAQKLLVNQKDKQVNLVCNTGNRSMIPMMDAEHDDFKFDKILHLFDNVAEMVYEVNFAKGSSWKHNCLYANPDSVLTYTSAQPWLGFRCVAQYINY